MRFLVAILFLTLIGTGAAAQKRSQAELLDNSVLLKFGPFALFGFDAGPEFYVEYLMPKQSIGIQLGVRPILYNPWADIENGNDMYAPDGVIKSSQPLGVEIRPEFKYYLNGFRPRRPRVYLSTDFVYQYTETNRLQEFPLNNGGTTFFREAEYKDIKEVYGFSFKSGLLIPLGEKPAMLEISYGLGLRFRNFRYENLPAGATNPQRPDNWFFGSQEENRVIPSIPLSFRFVYNLTHKKNKRVNAGGN